MPSKSVFEFKINGPASSGIFIRRGNDKLPISLFFYARKDRKELQTGDVVVVPFGSKTSVVLINTKLKEQFKVGPGSDPKMIPYPDQSFGLADKKTEKALEDFTPEEQKKIQKIHAQEESRKETARIGRGGGGTAIETDRELRRIRGTKDGEYDTAIEKFLSTAANLPNNLAIAAVETADAALVGTSSLLEGIGGVSRKTVDLFAESGSLFTGTSPNDFFYNVYVDDTDSTARDFGAPLVLEGWAGAFAGAAEGALTAKTVSEAMADRFTYKNGKLKVDTFIEEPFKTGAGTFIDSTIGAITEMVSPLDILTGGTLAGAGAIAFVARNKSVWKSLTKAEQRLVVISMQKYSDSVGMYGKTFSKSKITEEIMGYLDAEKAVPDHLVESMNQRFMHVDKRVKRIIGEHEESLAAGLVRNPESAFDNMSFNRYDALTAARGEFENTYKAVIGHKWKREERALRAKEKVQKKGFARWLSGKGELKRISDQEAFTKPVDVTDRWWGVKKTEETSEGMLDLRADDNDLTEILVDPVPQKTRVYKEHKNVDHELSALHLDFQDPQINDMAIQLFDMPKDTKAAVHMLDDEEAEMFTDVLSAIQRDRKGYPKYKVTDDMGGKRLVIGKDTFMMWKANFFSPQPAFDRAGLDFVYNRVVDTTRKGEESYNAIFNTLQRNELEFSKIGNGNPQEIVNGIVSPSVIKDDAVKANVDWFTEAYKYYGEKLNIPYDDRRLLMYDPYETFKNYGAQTIKEWGPTPIRRVMFENPYALNRINNQLSLLSQEQVLELAEIHTGLKKYLRANKLETSLDNVKGFYRKMGIRFNSDIYADFNFYAQAAEEGLATRNTNQFLGRLQRSRYLADGSNGTVSAAIGNYTNLTLNHNPFLSDKKLSQALSWIHKKIGLGEVNALNRFTPRDIQMAGLRITGMVHIGTLGGNPGPAIKNFTQASLTAQEGGILYWLRGLGEYITNPNARASKGFQDVLQNARNKEFLLDNNISTIGKKAKRGINNLAWLMFNRTEEINRSAYFAGRIQITDRLKRMGVNTDSEIAQKYIDRYGQHFTNKTQFAYGTKDSPRFLQPAVNRTLFQYMNFPIKYAEYQTTKALDTLFDTSAISIYGLAPKKDMQFNYIKQIIKEQAIAKDELRAAGKLDVPDDTIAEKLVRMSYGEASNTGLYKLYVDKNPDGVKILDDAIKGKDQLSWGHRGKAIAKTAYHFAAFGLTANLINDGIAYINGNDAAYSQDLGLGSGNPATPRISFVERSKDFNDFNIRLQWKFLEGLSEGSWDPVLNFGNVVNGNYAKILTTDANNTWSDSRSLFDIDFFIDNAVGLGRSILDVGPFNPDYSTGRYTINLGPATGWFISATSDLIGFRGGPEERKEQLNRNVKQGLKSLLPFGVVGSKAIRAYSDFTKTDMDIKGFLSGNVGVPIINKEGDLVGYKYAKDYATEFMGARPDVVLSNAEANFSGGDFNSSLTKGGLNDYFQLSAEMQQACTNGDGTCDVLRKQAADAYDNLIEQNYSFVPAPESIDVYKVNSGKFYHETNILLEKIILKDDGLSMEQKISNLEQALIATYLPIFQEDEQLFKDFLASDNNFVKRMMQSKQAGSIGLSAENPDPETVLRGLAGIKIDGTSRLLPALLDYNAMAGAFQDVRDRNFHAANNNNERTLRETKRKLKVLGEFYGKVDPEYYLMPDKTGANKLDHLTADSAYNYRRKEVKRQRKQTPLNAPKPAKTEDENSVQDFAEPSNTPIVIDETLLPPKPSAPAAPKKQSKKKTNYNTPIPSIDSPEMLLPDPAASSSTLESPIIVPGNAQESNLTTAMPPENVVEELTTDDYIDELGF